MNKKMPVLLEINTSGEKQKKGFLTQELEDVLMCFEEEHVQIRGLMTMAPFTHDKGRIRQSFISLRELKEKLEGTIGAGKLRDLSMGMSGDYEVAVEEGSTQIRLGTILFGPRQKFL